MTMPRQARQVFHGIMFGVVSEISIRGLIGSNSGTKTVLMRGHNICFDGET